MKLADLTFDKTGGLGGVRAEVWFPNGYGASVISGGMAYSNGKDTYELAVLKKDGDESFLCYDTPVTDDVLGYATEEEINLALEQIENLDRVNVHDIIGEEDTVGGD